MSVCKTEESLRRLKSRNVNPSEETCPQSDTMSDEMKIREQIKYDVSYFLEKVCNLISQLNKFILLSVYLFIYSYTLWVRQRLERQWIRCERKLVDVNIQKVLYCLLISI